MKKLVLIIFLLYLSCGPPCYFFVDDSYKNNEIKNHSLVIVPFTNGLDVSYTGNVREEMGEGVTEELIADFIFKTLPMSVKSISYFKRVCFDKYSEEYSFTARALYLKSLSDFTMKLPEDKTKLKFITGNADFVLFLEDFQISSSLGLVSTPLPIGPKIVGVGKNLFYLSKYALWDNINGQLVSYGIASSYYKENIPVIDKKAWYLNTSKFAEEILKGTPFRKPYSSNVDNK